MLSLRLSVPRASRGLKTSPVASTQRSLASVSSVEAIARNYKVVVVGGGSAGLNISHQLLRSGQFAANDIAIVDPARLHHYQPGWTLVGGGLKTKEELQRPMSSLIDPKIRLYNESVGAFNPDNNSIRLSNSDIINYDQLVVAPGININLDSIEGLPEALADRDSPVSTVYSYETCDKAHETISKFQKGRAIFTQPAGVIKCAGAPQKIMWLAVDKWTRSGLHNPENPSESAVQVTFANGLPTMFGVPKYAAKLEQLRQERGVEGLFQHDLVAIDGNTATFKRSDTGEQVKRHFDLLHVVPKMGPHAFVKESPLANEAGYVDVDDSTARHRKYPNVWSAGDASSLPTSKTAAAITSQSPVLVRNLLQALEGKQPDAVYDGYTSCPLLTEYGKVLLAEFKYGGQPKETFGWLGIDQATPRRAFYHLKKDFFPWVYYKSMVKGTWGGPKGWLK